jgi:hypothetical protein
MISVWDCTGIPAAAETLPCRAEKNLGHSNAPLQPAYDGRNEIILVDFALLRRPV